MSWINIYIVSLGRIEHKVVDIRQQLTEAECNVVAAKHHTVQVGQQLRCQFTLGVVSIQC